MICVGDGDLGVGGAAAGSNGVLRDESERASLGSGEKGSVPSPTELSDSLSEGS